MGLQVTLNTYDIDDQSCTNDPILILSATRCSPGMGYINFDLDENILSFNNIDNVPSLELCNTSKSNSNQDLFDENQFNINNQYYNIDECFEDGNGNERSSKFIVSENIDYPTILNGYCNQIKMFDCENYYIHSFKNNTCFRDSMRDSFTLMYCDQDTIFFKNCLNSDCSLDTCILNKILPSNINKCSNFNNTKFLQHPTRDDPTLTTTTTPKSYNDLNNNSIINNNAFNNTSNSAENNSSTNSNSTSNGPYLNKLNLKNSTTTTTNIYKNNNNNMTHNNNNTNNNNNYFYPKIEQSITSDSNSNNNSIKNHNNSIISAISITSTSSSITRTKNIYFNLLSLFIHISIVIIFLN